jgi:hypothetical protein
MISSVHGVMGKLFVTILLTLCVGVHALEVSGRWDRTFQDANDEAGIVAVVLCIGVALSAAGTLLRTLQRSRLRSQFIVLANAVVLPDDSSLALPTSAASPPLPLRI